MQYISGVLLRQLREKKELTQKELAEQLYLSEKTISKWETGRGLPDIAVLPELASALSVSVAELLAGEAVTNRNRAANMKRVSFYVCPVCGNVIAAVGESVISCCGIQLVAEEPETPDAEHSLTITPVEDEIFVEITHPMEKKHYISFLALCTDSRLELVKLYPEQNCEARFKKRGHGFLYAYCNRHGLMRMKF